MKTFSTISAFILFFCSCTQLNEPITQKKIINTDSLKEVLKQTDLAFSDRSKQVGMNAAFLAFASDSSVLLRPYSMPVKGIDSYQRTINRRTW